MSTYQGGYVDCETIQGRLNDYFRMGDRSFEDRDNPNFINFLLSERNTDGFLQEQIAPGDSKIRDVRATFQSRLPEDEVSEVVDKTCVATQEFGETSKVYTIDENVGVQITSKFTIGELERNCKSNPWWVERKLQEMMNAAVRKADTQQLETTQMLIGAFAEGEADVAADVKTIATKKANGDFDDAALVDVQFALLNAGYGDTPFIFGWNESYKYYQQRAMAGCCADGGVDNGILQGNFPYMYIPDPRVETVFGANNFITVEPGALQLLWYNQYEGIAVINDNAYKQMVIVDPRSGLPFDFMYKFDCGTIHMVISVALKTVGLPEDFYCPGDRKEGVTFVNQFQIVNP